MGMPGMGMAGMMPGMAAMGGMPMAGAGMGAASGMAMGGRGGMIPQGPRNMQQGFARGGGMMGGGNMGM
jgi:hypothetical protein